MHKYNNVLSSSKKHQFDKNMNMLELQIGLRNSTTGFYFEMGDGNLFEPRCEKTGFLHMRKQRRRSASR